MSKVLKKIKPFSVVVITLFVLSVAGNVFFYTRYKNAENNDPNIQTQRIVHALKKTTDVPDETPSVLTVVDKSKLADSQIAQKAENGDKILLFQKAGSVYIYRPSNDKLVTILGISTTSKSTSGTEAGSDNTDDPKTSPVNQQTKPETSR